MSNALTTLVATAAQRFGMETEASELVTTLKQTVFKGNVSDSQMVALLVVANQYGLNPFTREIYAFPDPKNGIVPVVGVDGWARIVNEHPMFDGVEFTFTSDFKACTCIMYRKDRQHPVTVTEFLEECIRTTAPWQNQPRRMLRHKAFIQCARLAFGFTGMYDEDEAERIRDYASAEVIPIKAGPQRKSQKAAEAAIQTAQQAAQQADVVDVDPETGEVIEAQPTQAEAAPEPEAAPEVLANETWITTLRARMKAAGKAEADVLAQFKLAKLEGITQKRAVEIAKWVTTA